MPVLSCEKGRQPESHQNPCLNKVHKKQFSQVGAARNTGKLCHQIFEQYSRRDINLFTMSGLAGKTQVKKWGLHDIMCVVGLGDNQLYRTMDSTFVISLLTEWIGASPT